MTLMYSKPRWNHVIMELANRAVNLVKFVCSALHLIIAIVVIYQICGVDCGTFLSLLTPKSYNTSDGRLCYMCGAGQFWVGDCIRPGEVAKCQPCTKGFFQAVENVERDCQQCTKNCTQQNQEFIEACNSTTDNICQCSSGYFKLDNKGFCKKHKTCAPGEGVIKPGNKDRDTTCESCLAGKYYSINESATEGCHLCTRCEVEMTPCTITSDAQCVTSGPPDGSQNMGVIVGIPVGASICLIIIIVIAVFCGLRRHRRNSHSPEDDSVRENFVNQLGPATSNGINSNPHPRELQIGESMDQVINSTDDVMENVESNEVLSDSSQAISSASIHKDFYIIFVIFIVENIVFLSRIFNILYLAPCNLNLLDETVRLHTLHLLDELYLEEIYQPDLEQIFQPDLEQIYHPEVE